MIYQFLDFELDAGIQELRNAGEPTAIEPQVFDLLLYLIENRDRLVSHDQLLESVWHGRIVADATIASRIRAVRKVLGDTGADQAIIQTIPRRGFRFVAPVDILPIGSGNEQPTVPGIAGGLQIPDKPSIAVLPFDNMSGDPEQEYFADGMTEDIITELSRFEDLFVIARNTSLTYKGQRIDVKEVAQELGVHFILEGSVRKAGSRVRITAQLVSGFDGDHVWAERYDGALEDVFDLQDQVTSQVVGSISPQITAAELERVGRGEEIFSEAHELAWRAEETSRSAYRLSDPPMLDQAIAMAIEAIEINPKCGIAYQTICRSYVMKSLFRWGDDPTASADFAEDWAKKFFSRVPNSYMAYFCLGLARLRKGQYQNANRDFQSAHDLNQNDTAVLNYWSWCEASAGEFENAKMHAHMMLRLSPKDIYPPFPR